MTARDVDASPLQTERLALEPLRVHHAEEMAPLLDDARLFAFTGGRPVTLRGAPRPLRAPGDGALT